MLFFWMPLDSSSAFALPFLDQYTLCDFFFWHIPFVDLRELNWIMCHIIDLFYSPSTQFFVRFQRSFYRLFGHASKWTFFQSQDRSYTAMLTWLNSDFSSDLAASMMARVFHNIVQSSQINVYYSGNNFF